MAFKYLNNAPMEEALSAYIESVKESGFEAGTEDIDVSKAVSRICSDAVYAKISAPHYPACAMDGIALKASDTFGATETTPVTIDKDKYVTVDTGDQLPMGCDAVIMVEEIIKLEDGSVRLTSSAAPWQHVRQIGEDICMGEMIAPSYTRITPSVIGSMLAGGVTKVSVLKQPVVGIIPTGDEIVPPSDNPKPGEIIEFNSSIFSSMLKEWGAKPLVYPIVKDEKSKLKAAIKNALLECDIVLMNAGSSAGRDDYTKEVIESFGSVICHGIAVRPGKPAILGISKNKPIIGIPGYPVSGIVIMDSFVKALIEIWNHNRLEESETINATLSKGVISGFKYKEFLRVKLGEVDGKWVASPLARGAGVVSSFMKADGILEIPQDVEGIETGESVKVKINKPMWEIRGALNIIGSHDPLIDEIGDILRREYEGLYLSSTHVGSMGGIMAMKRGECHLAGVHLLDEDDGSYNISYIKKYFPKGGVKLLRCIGRSQGIMIAKGNPKNITKIDDLKREGIRYVNRQKGAGTRILFDYLLKKYGISVSEIYGYEREELTHTSVAAQIAADTADAGMGIYSSANIYDLDFIPVCMETYDLLVSNEAFNSSSVKKVIEILGSEEFKNRLAKLGGYEISDMKIIEF